MRPSCVAGRSIVCALLLLGCGSNAASTGGAVDAAGEGCDPYAGSNQPMQPCAVDSDCHDPYLVCLRSTVDTCRDATATAEELACTAPWTANAPACPETGRVAAGLCEARYQLGCRKDGDCGPAGFACANGQCQQQAPQPCATTADCPVEWECSAPCACPGSARPRVCVQPFARFSCPACGPVPDDAGADAAD